MKVHVYGLQLAEFLEHPGPIVTGGLGRNGSVKVVVKNENIAAEFLRHFHVVALQPVQ
jgi:hypothetical protein